MEKTLTLKEVVDELERRRFHFNGVISEAALRQALQPISYSYYIDFEATCLDEASNADPQEIIEFPLVVLDAKTLSIIGKKQIYVKPRVYPVLTPFCMKLTGIQQEWIDKGVDFVAALQTMEDFLFTELKIPRDQMICVTCGDWDLASMLTRQCKQLNITKPLWASHFVNIKLLSQKYVPNSHSGSLLGLMQEVGLGFEGRQHSGIVDCENIARLLVVLLTKYGAKIEGPMEDRMKPLTGEDWRCSVCDGIVWASRTQCRDCKVPRTGSGTSSSPSPTPDASPAHHPDFKPGDWYCSQCRSLNFARRYTCFRKGCPGRK